MKDYSATDKGMADLLVRADSNVKQLQETHCKDMIRFPFTSSRKRMSTIISNATGSGDYDRRILIKGAAEMVKNCCTHYLDENAQVQ